MNRFEILPHTAGVAVKAEGSSKAALTLAAMQGMFAAAGPRSVPDAKEVERPFSVTSDGYTTLLIDVLNAALSQSDANHEAYDQIHFTLITDTKAEGEFVGKPVDGFGSRVKAATHQGLRVTKREDGIWETTVTFDV